MKSNTATKAKPLSWPQIMRSVHSLVQDYYRYENSLWLLMAQIYVFSKSMTRDRLLKHIEQNGLKVGKPVQENPLLGLFKIAFFQDASERLACKASKMAKGLLYVDHVLGRNAKSATVDEAREIIARNNGMTGLYDAANNLLGKQPRTPRLRTVGADGGTRSLPGPDSGESKRTDPAPGAGNTNVIEGEFTQQELRLRNYRLKAIRKGNSTQLGVDLPDGETIVGLMVKNGRLSAIRDMVGRAEAMGKSGRLGDYHFSIDYSRSDGLQARIRRNGESLAGRTLLLEVTLNDDEEIVGLHDPKTAKTARPKMA